MNAGVRFLDIRCRHTNNAFSIYHGPIGQNASFGSVLNAIFAFLKSNPTEAVIMSMKEEYNSSDNARTFEQTFNAYVARNPRQWYLGSSIPTLGQARGKIVLFRRFGAALPKGIDASNFRDNATFQIGNSLRVQDNYKVSDTDAKWSQILAMLNETRGGSPNMLSVNFASGVQSGYFGIPNIRAVSNSIKPRLTRFFSAHQSGKYGVVLMDFADAARCSLIYNTQRTGAWRRR